MILTEEMGRTDHHQNALQASLRSVCGVHASVRAIPFLRYDVVQQNVSSTRLKRGVHTRNPTGRNTNLGARSENALRRLIYSDNGTGTGFLMIDNFTCTRDMASLAKIVISVERIDRYGIERCRRDR
jgi:hypothetical protein